MLYPILILFFIFFLVLAYKMEESIFGVFCLICFIIIIFWSFLGGYKTITKPTYNKIQLESASIPELDTKKNKTGKYDISYVEKESKYVYIDKTTYNKYEVEIVKVDTEKELKMEVYKYVPKNTLRTSVNLLFNQKIKYKIYVPKNYKLCTKFKMK